MLDQSWRPQVVDVAAVGEDKLFVHDETSELSALIASRLGGPGLPTPIGVFRAVSRPTYEQMMVEQVDRAVAKGRGSVQDLLEEGAWTVD